MTVKEAIDLMIREGSRLATPVPVDGMQPMIFGCRFSPERASSGELELMPYTVPEDLIEFWNTSRFAVLFEDQQYGQWGLEILAPQEAVEFSADRRARRPREFVPSDLVVGRFLGDSDLLIIRCDPSASDFGQVWVALPLDPRTDWHKVADSFGAFLDRYATSGGEKYWSTNPASAS